jgi:cytochrome c-type biogenesis protein CcmH
LTALFVLIATALALGTTWILLRPLLREDKDAPGRPAHAQLAVVVVMLLLGATPVLYLTVGSPTGITSVAPAAAASPAAASGPAASAPDMETAMAQLQQRLRDQPDDVTGWMLLGRSHRAMQNFEASRDAFARAYALAAEEPDVLVDYAEALVLASSDRRFEGEAQRLLEQALARNAQHERGLLLLGVSHIQRGDAAAAAATWEQLAALLPPDSEALRPLRERIDQARAQAGLAPSAPPAQIAATGPSGDQAPAASDGGGVVVRVDINAELRQRIAASAALFVFVRDPAGGPAPVAVKRLPASGFPLMVRLTDADRMVPGTALSSLPQLRLSARISQSGTAAPAPGDLEAESLDFSPADGKDQRLMIDRVR